MVVLTPETLEKPDEGTIRVGRDPRALENRLGDVLEHGDEGPPFLVQVMVKHPLPVDKSGGGFTVKSCYLRFENDNKDVFFSTESDNKPLLELIKDGNIIVINEEAHIWDIKQDPRTDAPLVMWGRVH